MDNLYSLAFLLFVVPFSVVTARDIVRTKSVGVLLDLETLVGKMARTSITMAVEDFYAAHSNYSTRLALHTRDSKSNDVQAALAVSSDSTVLAIPKALLKSVIANLFDSFDLKLCTGRTALYLIQNVKTEVIVGPLKSSQAAIVSKIGNRSRVPDISFSATSPTLSSRELPYFVRSTISDSAQVSTIASIIKAYRWREVVPIYEDTDFGRDIIPFLADALQEIDVQIPYRCLIPTSSTDDQIREELYKLQTMQTRIFVVHMSSSRGSNLFLKAKEVGMMGEGYAWIMTTGMTHMINSFDPSVMYAMRGALGVQFYVPRSEELRTFKTRLKRRFQEDYPDEEFNEPSAFTLWAYDTIHALAVAVENVEIQNTRVEKPMVYEPSNAFLNGPQLLKAFSNVKFRGLSGNFEIIDRQLQCSAFEIINIVGYGIREIGYWEEKHGFSKQFVEGNNSTYSTSSHNLNPVIWPGDSIVVPKGWEVPVTGKKLRVGVRMSPYPELMKVEIDPVTNATRASGYAVDVFEAVVKRLPYAVPFEYVLFGGTSDDSSLSYDDFVYQVYLGNCDMVIGDITITYNRTLYADFSVPYTESGVAMIVPVKEAVNKNSFVIFKPLSVDLCFGSFAFFIYTGIAILILEPNIRASLEASFSGHVGNIVYLSLFAHQEKLESVLSKIVVVVWGFVLLVLSSSYTASLTSMLTVQQLQPTVTNLHDLIRNGENVGYRKGSFVKDLLDQLNVDKSKMRGYSTWEFARALDNGSANGGVAAIVHAILPIKLFLANYCNSYTMVGPIYKTAGYGFAFSKGSPLVADVSRAILNITGGDEIIQIEKKWIGDRYCPNNGGISTVGSNSLNFLSFLGLFLIAGAITTIMLIISKIRSICEERKHVADDMRRSTNSDTDESLPADNREGDNKDGPVNPSYTENVSDPTP